ncbi:hypothetical protein EUTSA_v100172671mg, partial [Eutrema salsugineum]
MTFSR